MNEPHDRLTVLKVEPMKKPYVKEIDPGLKSLQSEVGGCIEAVYPFPGDNIAIICHDEGKLIGLPYNRALRDGDGRVYDVICGDFLIAGISGDTFASLTPEQTERYLQMYSREMVMTIPRRDDRIR